MKIDGTPYRSIWVEKDGWTVGIIDQTRLPHEFVLVTLKTVEDAAHAIEAMLVRGAPLIGATAAYGMALAMQDDPSDAALERAYARLAKTRPTAINLLWALDAMRAALGPLGADFVCFSGTLNTMDDETARRLVLAGYEAAAQGVVFNFLSDRPHSKWEGRDLLPARRFDTVAWLDWVLDLGPRVSFTQDYLDGHDATVMVMH